MDISLRVIFQKQPELKMCTLELGWSSSQRLRAWAAALWEPESRADRVTT